MVAAPCAGLGCLRIPTPLRGGGVGAGTCPGQTRGSECPWAADGEARPRQAQRPPTAAGTTRTLTETTSSWLAVPLGPTVQARRLRLRTGGDPLGPAAGECRRGPPALCDLALCMVLVTGWVAGLEEVGCGDAQKQTRGARIWGLRLQE